MIKRMTSIAFAIGMALTSLSFEAHAQTAAAGPYYAVPSWDQTLPAASRFVVLTNFANQAVLDRETGLVWMRTPLPPETYALAFADCLNKRINGKLGWRLPSVAELLSLFDDTATSSQLIPAGHPFILPPTQGVFWTSTPGAQFAGQFVTGYFTFQGNLVIDTPEPAGLTSSSSVWCVRGPGDMGTPG
jgi:Protein of unknown function (DUF1566)